MSGKSTHQIDNFRHSYNQNPISLSFEIESKITSKILEMGKLGASFSEIWELSLIESKMLLYNFLKNSQLLTQIHFSRFVHIQFASHWLIPVYKNIEPNMKKFPSALVQPRIWLGLDGSFQAKTFEAAFHRIYVFIKDHPGISLVC